MLSSLVSEIISISMYSETICEHIKFISKRIYIYMSDNNFTRMCFIRILLETDGLLKELIRRALS